MGTSRSQSWHRLCEASARRVDPPQSCRSSRRVIMQKARDLSAAADDLRHDHASKCELGNVWRDLALHKTGAEENSKTGSTTTPMKVIMTK